MEALNKLDRGWQLIISFNIGDNVKFDIPYLGGSLNYIGVVKELVNGYAVIEYNNNQGIKVKSHVSLVDDKGYRRVSKVN